MRCLELFPFSSSSPSVHKCAQSQGRECPLYVASKALFPVFLREQSVVRREEGGLDDIMSFPDGVVLARGGGGDFWGKIDGESRVGA